MGPPPQLLSFSEPLHRSTLLSDLASSLLHLLLQDQFSWKNFERPVSKNSKESKQVFAVVCFKGMQQISRLWKKFQEPSRTTIDVTN